MAEDYDVSGEWEDIPQSEWDDITLRVDDEGEWHLRFDYENEYGDTVHFQETDISFDEFLAIYDEAAELDQELEIEY